MYAAGAEGVRAILTSPSPTFWEAVEAQSGLSRRSFDRALREWLRKRAPNREANR